MLSTQRLAPIHELARKREDEAVRVLAETRRLLALRESQLCELERYTEPASTALSVEMLRNREVFRQKLGEAIIQQRRVIEQVKRQMELHRQQWIEAHQQTEIYARLVDRAQQQEASRQALRDQRDQDELALRLLRAQAAS